MRRDLQRELHLCIQLQRYMRERHADAVLRRDDGMRRMLSAPRRARGIIGLALVATVVSAQARAQSTIRSLARGPSALEFEPHADVALFAPPAYGTGFGYGLGGRVAIEIVHRGFVPSINDSVAIGFGADVMHYDGSGTVSQGSRCIQYVSGPAGTMVCSKAVTPGGASNYVFMPVVMQWNFWLSPAWSVFGEPGIALYASDIASVSVVPVFYAGGRYRFSDAIAIVFRIGYPTVSVGASFLF